MARNGVEAASSEGGIPGELGIWVVVFGDLMVFSCFFLVFLDYRSDDLATFRASQGLLQQPHGLLNTLLMLASSAFVAQALRALRDGAGSAALRSLQLAFACGLGFGLVKVVEYAAKFALGVNAYSNDFFMFYFIFTGIHMCHVLVAMGVLWYLMRLARSGRQDSVTLRNFESGAVFWHVVDLLWIVLFALLYLLP